MTIMKSASRLQSLALSASLLLSLAVGNATAQGIHFSQYYNAPMLTSPANTGLMSEHDYRLGANYRTQWGAVPVPYKTLSAYGDLQVFRAKNETNWLGLGAAVFTDKAGDGDLSLNRYEAFLAYHIQLGEYQMISFGASVASVQRTVDFNKFTWDAQWDGYAFDHNMPSNERNTVSKTSYTDLTAGLNYAIYPNEFVYIKIGAGAAHINQPKETFFGNANTVGIRPTGNADVLARVGRRLIINPSVLYTTQKSASELMYGCLFIINVGGDAATASNIVAGAYHRWNDAIVTAIGYEWSGLRIMASYDYTISNLGQYINHNGAAELGLVWQGKYRDAGAERRRAYGCPRF
jgi:type IX secretion system PorP/SprF family membrane protein